MKIPKTVAKWMYRASLAGMAGGFVAPLYFIKERQETLESSPTYMGKIDIEEKVPIYEIGLAGCVPKSVGASVSEECVALRNAYDSSLEKLTNLKNNPEYISTMKRADTLESHAENSPYVGFLFVIPFLIGTEAYGRRKEEFAEKNPEIMKRSAELEKDIKR